MRLNRTLATVCAASIGALALAGAVTPTEASPVGGPTVTTSLAPTSVRPASVPQSVHATFRVPNQHIRADQKFTLTARPGASFAGRVAVLEELDHAGHRYQVRQGVVSRAGTVKFTGQVSAPGTHTLRVRVIRNRTTLAVSARFTATVTNPPDWKKVRSTGVRAAAALALAEGHVRMRSSVTQQHATPPIVSDTDPIFDTYNGGISGPEWQGFAVGNKWIDVSKRFPADTSGKALDPVKEGSDSFLSTFVKKAAGGAGYKAGELAAEGLIGLMFPSTKTSSSTDAIDALSTQMQADFAQVDAQLASISAQITALSTQLAAATAQQEQDLAQTDAAVKVANCSALLTEANQYADRIQAVEANYASMLNPQWMRANLLSGTSSTQNLTTVGTLLFGQGAGNPQFLSGLNAYQQDVTDLATLLTANGPAGGIVQTCADAASAEVGANGSLLYGPQGTLQLGAADEAYFNQLQSITDYYTALVNLGQFHATFGAYLAILSVSSPLPLSPVQASGMCSTATAANSDLLTCAGLLYARANTDTLVKAAWNLTGASWDQVSFGVATSDSSAPIAGTALHMTPASKAWVSDIATYGHSSNLRELTGLKVAVPATGCNQTGTPTPCDGHTMTVTSHTATAVTVTETGFASGQTVQLFLSESGRTLGIMNITTDASGNASATFNPFSYPAGSLDMWWQGYLPTSTYWGSQVATLLVPDIDAYATFTPVGGGAGATQNLSAYGSGLRDPSWLGLPFTPALSADYERVLRLNQQACVSNCTAPQPMGAYLAQAGLSNDNATPSNLILLTGEQQSYTGIDEATFPTNPNGLQSMNYIAFDTEPSGPHSCSWSGGQSPSSNWSQALPVSAWSFLDASYTGKLGWNSVIHSYNAPVGHPVTADFMSPLTNGPASSSYTAQPWSGWMSPYAANLPAFPTNTWVSNVYSPTSALTGQGSASTGYGNWYQPIVQQNSVFWDSLLYNNYCPGSYGFGYTSNAFTQLPSYAQAGPINNHAAVNGTPSANMWPTLNLKAAPAPCALTSFTSGVSGEDGVTQVCQQLWRHYATAVYGVDTGGVSVSFDDLATQQPTGDHQAHLVVDNTSGSSQAVTLSALSVDGNATFASGVGSDATSPHAATVSSCLTNASLPLPTKGFGANNVVCSITVPSGISVVDLPMAFGSGKTSSYVAAAVSNSAVSASTTGLLTHDLAGSGTPGAVTNLKAAAGTTANTVTLTWVPPAATTPAVTSYALTLSDPRGTTSTQTILMASVSGAPLSHATVTLPAVTGNATGTWTVSLAATNAYGSGAAGTATYLTGSQAPPAVSGLTTAVNPSGTISLDWSTPVVSPAVTKYTVVQVNPDGTTNVAATTSNSAWVSGPLAQTGTYRFTVTATNSLGTGPAASANVTVTGVLPSAVDNLATSLSSAGWLSASWLGAKALPAVTSYTVTIANSGGTSVFTASYPVTGANKTVEVPYFFQLGTQPAGTYTVTVTATNSIGTGLPAQSSVYISAAMGHSAPQPAPTASPSPSTTP